MSVSELVVPNETKEGVLITTTTRPPCPFYGFVGMQGILIDNHGNGCGIAGGHRPCAMEMSGRAPRWKECQFNNDAAREMLIQAFDVCKIFPDELRPPHTPDWAGVSLRGWFQLILRE